MKSIIISGDQNTGKSTLAKIIAAGYKSIGFDGRIDRKDLSEDTECIVVDGVSHPSEFADFKLHASMDEIEFRRPYAKLMSKCKPKLLICVTQLPMKREDVLHSLLFNLK